MITLRPATLEDALLLFKWRNDSTTRRWFWHGEEITWGEHLSWLREVLNDVNSHFFIGEQDSKAFGTFRFSVWEGEGEVSVTVASEARSRGIGAELIRVGTELALQSGTVKRLRASIMKDNIASQKAFAKAGYLTSDDSTESVVAMYAKR